MDRRDFMKASAVSVALGAICGEDKKSERPNIIFYLTEDHNKVSIEAYVE